MHTSICTACLRHPGPMHTAYQPLCLLPRAATPAAMCATCKLRQKCTGVQYGFVCLNSVRDPTSPAPAPHAPPLLNTTVYIHTAPCWAHNHHLALLEPHAGHKASCQPTTACNAGARPAGARLRWPASAGCARQVQGSNTRQPARLAGGDKLPARCSPRRQAC
jgi:hypothetical protein